MQGNRGSTVSNTITATEVSSSTGSSFFFLSLFFFFSSSRGRKKTGETETGSDIFKNMSLPKPPGLQSGESATYPVL